MNLKLNESLGARLAANVDDVVSVGEAVELGGGALGVGAHVLKVEPVAHIEDGVEADALGNAVDSVAGRAPDRVLNTLASRNRVGNGSVVQGLATSAQDLGNGVLVVEHDAREVAVDAVVDVHHVALAVKSGVLDGAASNDVAGNGEGGRHIVPTRLSNDLNVAAGGEELVEGAVKNGSHILKGVSGEATSNVESAHVKAALAGLLEDNVGIADGLEESHGVRSTRADVEAHANDIEAKLTSKRQESLGGVHSSTELHGQAAKARGVVRHDAEEQLSARVELGNLVELIGIVKGHLLDAHGLDIADVRVGLAGLSIDDTVGAGSHGQDLLNLRLGGTVEARAKLAKELEHLGIRVAFDRCDALVQILSKTLKDLDSP